MYFRKDLIFLFVCFSMVLFSCKQNKKSLREIKGSDEHSFKLVWKPFYLDLLKLKDAKDSTPLLMMRKNYVSFYEQFNTAVINIGPSTSPLYTNRINDYLYDKDIAYVYSSVDSVYNNSRINTLKEELNLAFGIFTTAFPKKQIPAIAPMITGFNYAVIVGDSILGISLDMFLCKIFNYYTLLQFPEYKKNLMTKENLVPRALFSWIKTEFEPPTPPADLLGEMIEAGKVIYLLNHLLPELEDSLAFGYTAAQMDWCKTNEFQIWATFVDKKLLFSSTNSENQKYVNEAPFSPGFSKESPGKIGYFIGYRIVESYMENNLNVTLNQLMENHDSHLILNRSKYKPKK
jgi:hypothetical protein